MSAPRRIARNTLFLTAADAVRKLLALLLVIYIARHLGDVGFGRYSFAFAFTGLFALAADLGLGTLTIRDVAADKSQASRYLGAVMVIKSVLSLFVFALIAILISLMHYPWETTLAVYIVAGFTVLISFSGTFRSIFIAFERMEYESIIGISEKVIVFCLGLFVLLSGYGLIALVSVFLVAGIVDVLLGFFIVTKKFAVPTLKIDRSFYVHLIKMAIPFSLIALFYSVYFQIDIVLLSLMKGDAVVGWYSAAYKLVSGLLLIPLFFMVSIFPAISGFFRMSEESLKTAYDKAFKYLFILVLPIVAGTFLLADKLILTIYTAQFVNSIHALRILIFAFLFLSMAHVLGVVLLAIGKELTALKITGTGAGLNVILDILLIPMFGLSGACIASVATISLVFVLGLYFTSRYLQKVPFCDYITLLKVAASVGVMIALILLASYMEIHLFLIIPLAALVYFLTLYLLRCFSEEDMEMFRTVLGI